jgi:uncharacterized membrane protein
MTYVEVEIEISRSAEEVFAYIANFENNPRWQNGIQEAVITSAEPFGEGSAYTQVARFLGRRIESNFIVTAYEAKHRIAFETVTGSFPIQIERSVEARNGGAIVRAIISGDSSGFYRIFAPLLDFMVRQSIKADYARLKKILESA